MTTATELPASDPSSTSTLAEDAPRHPEEQAAPVTMLNPDFPFSYDHYLPTPAAWARFRMNCWAPKSLSSGPGFPAWSSPTN